MGRPSDWSPVGWHTDPTPGDPDAVADLAARYRRTAEAVRTAATGLTTLQERKNYVGKGGDALRERSRDLSQQVSRLHERYAEAAAALDGYHPEQHAAQVTADAALSRAREAQTLQSSAARTIDTIDRTPPPPPGQPADPDLALARGAAQRDLDHAVRELNRARTDVQHAHDAQRNAGAAAARRLEAAIAGDGLNDSWKDDVLGVVKVITDVAGIVAAIAGVLSLVFGWLPVLGELLAAVVLLAGLVTLLAHVTLAVTGKASWGQVATDVIGLATLGIGRALAASGKLAAVATRGRAWNYARTMVSGNRNARYRAVRTLLGGPLRGANGVLSRANARGLLDEGLHATAPGTLARETVDALRDVRRVWQQPRVVLAEVREAASTFSGGSWRGVPGALIGYSTPELRALSRIDPAALPPSAALAKRLQVGHAGVRLHDFRRDVEGLIPDGPPAVNPARVGVGHQAAGLPSGFTAPSPHISPTPAPTGP